MSKDKISDYSATANSNTDIAGINIDEGCAPSGINDAIRTLMKQLKDFQQGTNGDSFNGPVGSTTRSTGAFTSISTTGDITIDNGSADGGQLLLASSGYSNWGIDNYSGNFRWYYNTSEKMRLDNSGNLGLGVTPSAWGSGIKVIQFGPAGSVFSNTIANALMASNAYYDGTNWRYINTNTATYYSQNDGLGRHAWHTAPSGTAGNPITFNQAMTLDASSALIKYGSLGNITLTGSGAGIQFSRTAENYFDATSSGGSFVWRINGNTGDPNMKLDSSGNILFGTTGIAGRGGFTVRPNLGGAATYCRLYLNGNNADDLFYFQYQDTTVGRISITTNSTAYVTSSDYRLKEDVQPLTGALARVAALKPVTYKWKSDGSDGEGFIAHELAEVCPHSVTGEKDAVDEDGKPAYQGIDTSFLVATLTAAIQEQQAIIDAQASVLQQLQADVAALKG